MAVKSRSTATVGETTCTSSSVGALKVVSSGKCAALLTGTESYGQSEVSVRVSAQGLKVEVPFRVHMLQSVSVKTSLATLRPIKGLYAANCSTLQYQSATVTVLATFADGSGTKIVGYDVSRLARLAVDADSVAVIVDSHDGHLSRVVGRSPGNVAVSVLSASGGMLGAAKVSVSSQTPSDWAIPIASTSQSFRACLSVSQVSYRNRGSYRATAALDLWLRSTDVSCSTQMTR